MSYATAYPLGICGILLAMWLSRRMFCVRLDREVARWHRDVNHNNEQLYTLNMQVENPNLINMAIKNAPLLNGGNLICSRLKRSECLMVPAPETRIQPGDLSHLAGRETDLYAVQLIIGRIVDASLSTRSTELQVMPVAVTNEKARGKKFEIYSSNSVSISLSPGSIAPE